MELERKTAVALKWSTLAKVISQAVSWSVTLIVLRLLVPEDYGLMAMATVVISVTAGLAEFGLGASLIQAPTVDKRQLAHIAGFLGSLNVGCGMIVAVCAPFIARFFEEPRLIALIQIAALQFLFAAIEVVPQSLLYRELNFARVARIEIATTLVASLTTLVLAWSGAGVWALVLGNLAGAGVRAVLFAVHGGFVWPSFTLQGIGAHIRFGGTVTVTRVLWQITHQMDTIIAARFLTRDSLGLYSVAMQLANLPMSKAMSIVNQVALPAVARLQEELPRLRLRLLESLRLLAFVAIPSLWGLCAVAEEFVDVVLGARWHGAIAALQLVSLSAPIRMLSAVLATALAAVGRPDLELRNTATSAVVLPISFAVGVQWDLVGVAASWLVAVPVVFLLNFRRTFGALGLQAARVGRAVFAPVLAGATMLAAVSLARFGLLQLEAVIRLPILIAIGALSYFLAIQLLDRAIWRDVRRLSGALRG